MLSPESFSSTRRNGEEPPHRPALLDRVVGLGAHDPATETRLKPFRLAPAAASAAPTVCRLVVDPRLVDEDATG